MNYPLHWVKSIFWMVAYSNVCTKDSVMSSLSQPSFQWLPRFCLFSLWVWWFSWICEPLPFYPTGVDWTQYIMGAEYLWRWSPNWSTRIGDIHCIPICSDWAHWTTTHSLRPDFEWTWNGARARLVYTSAKYFGDLGLQW